MDKSVGFKSGLSSRKPLGQKAPRGETKGQRPVKDPDPKSSRK